MAFRIKFKRGTKANLPTLSDGEPAFTTDEKELYIGSSSSGNIKLTRNSEVDELKSNSHTHSNKSIIDTITSALISNWNSAFSHISDAVKHITASERSLWNTVSDKADSGHTHDDRYYTESEANSKFATKSEISSLGSGDMLKSVYDTNGDGVVDKAASVDWSGITSKPSTYTPSSHTHNYAGSSSAGGAATSALVCTGNSATATKLQTARTLTIGSTGKSFDGSGNISWSLTEIGAAAISHEHSYLPLSGGTMTGSLELKYGANILTGQGITTGNNQLIGTTADTVYIGNPITKLELEGSANPIVSVGGTKYTLYHTGNNPTPADIGAAASSHTHNYAGSSSVGGAATSALVCTGNSATATKLATARTINGVSFDGSANITITAAANGGTSAACSGNSATATTLQTARTINGTSFNGSANITTANWGTARTLTIGNTGKSVNGSGNVSWSLAEIGAMKAGPVTWNNLKGV